jgi:hypothetical protein
MEQTIEYIIAGGPQHGLLCRQPPGARLPEPLTVATVDGQLCIAAARRHAGTTATRFILLHPQATGEQFLTMLAA